jgi:hypothetical protein
MDKSKAEVGRVREEKRKKIHSKKRKSKKKNPSVRKGRKVAKH